MLSRWSRDIATTLLQSTFDVFHEEPVDLGALKLLWFCALRTPENSRVFSNRT